MLLTGDIAAKTGSEGEYAEVAAAVAHSPVAILPCSGNHDDPGRLAAHPGSLVALHHPSVDIGDAMFDQIRLDDQAAAGLAAVCERRRPVAVLHGHAHREHRSTIGGAPLFVCPSSAYGFDCTGPRLVAVAHAPRWALHHIGAGGMTTDVVNVAS